MRELANALCEKAANSRWLHWLGRRAWLAATGEDPQATSRLLTAMERLNGVHAELIEDLNQYAQRESNQYLTRRLAMHENERLEALHEETPTAELTHPEPKP